MKILKKAYKAANKQFSGCSRKVCKYVLTNEDKDVKIASQEPGCREVALDKNTKSCAKSVGNPKMRNINL